MTSKELVYLEDVEPARKTAVRAELSSTTVEIATPSDKKPQGTTIKRQISIADMFSKAPSDGSSSKRQRVDHGASVSFRRSGVLPLNAVPLNLDVFRASLSEETRKLLALEMETMGKSWFVFVPPLPCVRPNVFAASG